MNGQCVVSSGRNVLFPQHQQKKRNDVDNDTLSACHREGNHRDRAADAIKDTVSPPKIKPPIGRPVALFYGSSERIGRLVFSVSPAHTHCTGWHEPPDDVISNE